MVPKSILNDLRRQAVELLRQHRAAAARHEIVEPAALDALRSGIASGAKVDSAVQIHVLVRTFEQLEAVLDEASGVIYCDFRDFDDCERAVAAGRATGRVVGLAAPRVVMPGEEKVWERIVGLRPDAVLVRNLGTLCALRRLAPEIMLVGDHSLNVANEITARLLVEAGLVRVTPGYDVNRVQLASLLARFDADRVEVVVHGHVPMFHMRHCLFAAGMSMATDCGECDRPCDEHDVRLRDRTGVDHPVVTDGMGRSTVFHASAQSAAAVVPEMMRMGLRHFRMELLDESGAQARRAIAMA
jgi:putative protease